MDWTLSLAMSLMVLMEQSLEDMAGPGHIPTLISAVKRVYQRYMVEVINTPVFRKQLSKSQLEDREVYGGTATTYAPRLVVDYTSKLILQVLLATMTALLVLAQTQIKLPGLVPRSPYSIANIMAFLAGSKLCADGLIPESVEHMSEKQLKEVLGLHEYVWLRVVASQPRPAA